VGGGGTTKQFLLKFLFIVLYLQLSSLTYMHKCYYKYLSSPDYLSIKFYEESKTVKITKLLNSKFRVSFY
jgi:hypothetical protein